MDLRRTGSTIDWRDECVVHSKLSPTRDDQRTTTLAGATYSITGARCHCHHPQTQIRFTGFPVLTQLIADAEFLARLLLDQGFAAVGEGSESHCLAYSIIAGV